MRYRRAWIPGGSFFFIVVTAGRRPVLASAEAVEVWRSAFCAVRSRCPVEVDAVIMPDHVHCIWTLPPDVADFATRWRLIKTWFTKHCDPVLRGNVPGYNEVLGYAALTQPTTTTPAMAIWQHRYWEHVLRDVEDYARHMDYIHFNPVKHGLVSAASECPYSSFQRFVEAGLYPPDWGQGVMNFEGVGHE